MDVSLETIKDAIAIDKSLSEDFSLDGSPALDGSLAVDRSFDRSESAHRLNVSVGQIRHGPPCMSGKKLFFYYLITI